MNYTVEYTRIKSNWFDEDSVYNKIGYKGLYLYFQLYKFRLHNQEHDHIFVTSIGLLRKETGYSMDEVLKLLKILCKVKVIKLQNVSRWEYLLDEDRVKNKELLVIIACDVPCTVKNKVDVPVSEDDRYIGISFAMFEYYHKLKLNHKYVALYCLLNKWNNNVEKKSYMSIDKMASILGFGKSTLHKMIKVMNEYYLLDTKRKKRKGKSGYKFEHYLATDLDRVKRIESQKVGGG